MKPWWDALERRAKMGLLAGAGGRLDLKRDTDNYLARKAGAVLELSLIHI